MSIALTLVDNTQAIIDLVLDSLPSEQSKTAYGKALKSFMAWYELGKPGLNKATVQRYRAVLIESGLAPATVNLSMSAIRKLVQEAADNGLLKQEIANGVARIKGVPSHGVRSGNWLTKEQAQTLISLPDSTLRGLRNRAILAVMLGAGLRRSEVASLCFTHVQMRDARWVISDLIGKGNRVRTVPIPAWCKVALDTWTCNAGISEGYIFRAIYKGNHLHGDAITPQAVYDVVQEYATLMGLHLAAHDTRRSFARLAYRGGSGIDQIQLSLGHASITTTERYLGVAQDLTDAPCDRLGLRFDPCPGAQ
jgi:integrase